MCRVYAECRYIADKVKKIYMCTYIIYDAMEKMLFLLLLFVRFNGQHDPHGKKAGMRAHARHLFTSIGIRAD